MSLKPQSADLTEILGTLDDSLDRRRGALEALAASAAATARDRAAKQSLGLSQLLAERPELRGVHAPADLAYDAIAWTA